MSRFSQAWNQRREQLEEPVTRIASFNLLVVSRGEEEDELQSVLQGLTKSHPARTIWAKIDPGKSWSNSTGRLHLGCRPDDKQVCSEQIQICCGDEPSRVSSIILPLIHSGLPTHLLWWHSGPPEGPLFERLADRCRLILMADKRWSDLADTLPYLWEDPLKSEHAFYPLTWFKLTSARQKIAAAYSCSNIELALPKDIGAPGPFAEILTTWLRSLLPVSDFQDGTVQVVSSSESSVPTLHWSAGSVGLESQNSLDAVRQALDRPFRDPVFRAIAERLKER